MSAEEKEIDRMNREIQRLKEIIMEMGELEPLPDTQNNLRVI